MISMLAELWQMWNANAPGVLTLFIVLIWLEQRVNGLRLARQTNITYRRFVPIRIPAPIIWISNGDDHG